ncbi:MAG: hypothetical protein ACI9J3_001283 [Parvicellaceae bacterium]|jgi:hypothetical protein
MKWLIPLILILPVLIGCSQMSEPKLNTRVTTVMLKVDTIINVQLDTVPYRVSRTLTATDIMSVEEINLRSISIGWTESYYGRSYMLGMDSLWSIYGYEIAGDEEKRSHFLLHFSKGQLIIEAEEYEVYDYYGSDTLIDVDFDGDLDYLVNTYSGMGCCPRNHHRIYLNTNGTLNLEEHTGTFNADFNAITEHVYTTDYGHPPYNAIYKNRWQGDSLFEVANIGFRFETDSIGNDSILDPEYLYRNRLTGKDSIMKEIPTEYQGIYDFGWFAWF